MRGLLALAFCLAASQRLCALEPQKQIGQYVHDIWTAERGLPGEAVHQILQTKDGYLWIRTGSGLSRFDGVRFVPMDAEMGSEPVRAMCMGADGDLLIRTTTRTIVYKDQQFSDYLPPVALPDGGARVLFESRDHVVFAGTENFIYELDKTGPKLLRDGTGTINAFWEDGAGAVWIGGSSSIFKHAGSSLAQPFYASRKPADATLRFSLVPIVSMSNRVDTRALMQDHLHNLWAATSDGLYSIERYQSNLKAALIESIPGRSHFAANTLLEDRQRNIWIGTQGGGVVRLTDGRSSLLDTGGGLTDNDVRSLFEDREGSLWIGTSSGLDRLRDTKLTTFTTREGMTGNDAKSAVATRDGNLFVSGDGGLTSIRNSTATAFAGNASLASRYAGTSFEARDGTLWVATAHGLNSIKDGKVKVYDGGGSFSNFFLPAIGEDDEGLIIANSESRALRLQNGKATPFTIEQRPTPFTFPGADSRYIFTMYYDGEGNLWVGSNRGFYKHIPSLPGQKGWRLELAVPATSIYDDHQGNLWLGGRFPGLIQFRTSDGRATHITKHVGLSDTYVSHVLADDNGHLWISTEEGIFEAGLKDLDDFADGRLQSVPSTKYGLADGMKTVVASDTGSQPGGARTPDGRLWFTTMKGIVAIDPRHMLYNSQVPPVVIETVGMDGSIRPFRQNQTIEPGVKSLEFHYTALSFLVPERVHFKYQLMGYDRDWIDAGPRRVAYYTNLSPGNYRFRVIAANDDGMWNTEGASLSVFLKPHYYETLSFFVACAVLAASALLLAYRRNTQQIRARSEELGRIVAERTAELEKSKQELAQIAHFDALTNLPNRRMFNETFSKMRERAHCDGVGFSMILIDFDKFKQINDTHGHDAGDAFLVEASIRLRAAVRPSDFVARLGGDEFAILTGDDQQAMRRICSQIVNIFTDAISFKNIKIRTSASVGVAVFPDHGNTQEELYKSADLALYQVKQMGKNNWMVYSQMASPEPMPSGVAG